MNPRFTLPLISAVSILLGLSSCTVYAPMQPTISTITGQGQAELSASIQPSGRLEAGGVYSPLPHTLVMAAATFRPRLSDSTFFTTRQWEAGLGTYWALGRRWQVNAVAGYGTATTDKVFQDFDILDNNPPYRQYQTSYNKVFGQLGLNRQSGRSALGVVYRLAKIDFTRLDYSPSYGRYGGQLLALPADDMIRHELLFFYRRQLDQHQKWQVQLTMGFSADINELQNSELAHEYYEDRRTYRPVPMASLGVVFRPRLSSAKPIIPQP